MIAQHCVVNAIEGSNKFPCPIADMVPPSSGL